MYFSASLAEFREIHCNNLLTQTGHPESFGVFLSLQVSDLETFFERMLDIRANVDKMPLH